MSKSLRDQLSGDGFVVAPGAYDAITARLIEDAGFSAVYMSGGGTSAAHGLPDFGLLTMTEMAAAARRMSDAVRVPVIADADTGFGGTINVIRTVREYDRAGVAAIQLEDQTFPKRCGHLGTREVVPIEEFLNKVRAAAGERSRDDLLIIARTDALASEGADGAIDRMGRAIDAGADIAFVEAPRDLETIARIPREVPGPCMLSIVHGGRTPLSDLAEARRMGYSLVIVPGILHMSVLASGERVLRALSDAGALPPLPREVAVAELFDQVGAQRWDALAQSYERD